MSESEFTPELTETAELVSTYDHGEYIIEGVYDALECADDIEDLYLNGPKPGLNTGLANLDAHYRPKKGNWTVITGVPGSGKSTLLDTILVNLSELHGWKHLVISPEHQPISRHIGALTGIKARQTFHKDYLSEEAYFSALEFIQEHFRFIKPPDEDFTPSYILDLAKFVDDDGFKFDSISIDPWNEMEHKRPQQFNETEYVSYALSRFRRYVRDYYKHIFLVAHPTKLRKIEKKNADFEESSKPQYPVVTPYDISGSAHFFNKCDNALSVWRDKYAHDTLMRVYIQKIRFRECGSIGEAELRFDWHSGRVENV